MIDNGIEKIITIRYNDFDTLLDREVSMMQTLQNYLNRNDEYEFKRSYIEVTHNKFVLNLVIRLKDEHNKRTDY